MPKRTCTVCCASAGRLPARPAPFAMLGMPSRARFAAGQSRSKAGFFRREFWVLEIFHIRGHRREALQERPADRARIYSLPARLSAMPVAAGLGLAPPGARAQARECRRARTQTPC